MTSGRNVGLRRAGQRIPSTVMDVSGFCRGVHNAGRRTVSLTTEPTFLQMIGSARASRRYRAGKFTSDQTLPELDQGQHRSLESSILWRVGPLSHGESDHPAHNRVVNNQVGNGLTRLGWLYGNGKFFTEKVTHHMENMHWAFFCRLFFQYFGFFFLQFSCRWSRKKLNCTKLIVQSILYN